MVELAVDRIMLVKATLNTVKLRRTLGPVPWGLTAKQCLLRSTLHLRLLPVQALKDEYVVLPREGDFVSTGPDHVNPHP